MRTDKRIPIPEKPPLREETPVDGVQVHGINDEECGTYETTVVAQD